VVDGKPLPDLEFEPHRTAPVGPVGIS